MVKWKISLFDEKIKFLENINSFNPAFAHWMIVSVHNSRIEPNVPLSLASLQGDGESRS